jgi:hypothetical protein
MGVYDGESWDARQCERLIQLTILIGLLQSRAREALAEVKPYCRDLDNEFRRLGPKAPKVRTVIELLDRAQQARDEGDPDEACKLAERGIQEATDVDYRSGIALGLKILQECRAD